MAGFDSRINGLVSGAAYKIPVRVATTANITLSGLQTVDGVALASGDRVLVMDQTNEVENGIYDVTTTGWNRSKDFNKARDAVQGTQIWVNNGTVNGENFFRVSTPDPFIIGTDDVNFTVSPGAGTMGPQGDQGEQGIQGIQGEQGEPGATGATGATGPQGPIGLTGLPGDPGATGAQGVQGIPGNTGPQGAKGDKGDKGLTFQGQWATTTVYAVDDVVRDAGSSYICIFGHTSDANKRPGSGVDQAAYWEPLALKGDTGATGATGDQGPVGPMGPPVDDGDKGDIVVSSSGTVWTFDTGVVTAFAKTFLDDVDAAAVRTTLGLVIGTDVQAYDAELAAIAGLTSAANKIPYFTGVGTAGVLDFSTVTTLGSSDTTIPSQLAVKTYVDTSLATIMVADTAFTIYDSVDPTKQAQFELSGITAGNLRTITIPNISGTLATTANLSQTYSGQITSTNNFFHTGINATLGNNIGTVTLGIGSGATANGVTKTLNFGTAGLSGSTTNINIGSATGGALGTTIINTPTLTIVGAASAASLTLGTALALTEGGTGSTTASGARTNLGLVIGTDVQAYDAELAAIAGLTSAANKIPYFTGSGTAGLLDFSTNTSLGASNTTIPSQNAVKTYVDAAVTAGTIPDGDKGDIVVSSSGTVWTFDTGVVTAFAKTFLDDVDASAVRTTLGLVIGTNVQAYDAELAAIAGLTSAADRLPYFTGSGTASLATFTSGGRALVNSAGTANTYPYFSASNTVTLQAVTSGGRALGALTYAADQIGYTTSASAAAATSLTSFARTLIDDTDAATMRTTLGLVIGTNVQAYDAELAALAGLTSAANKIPYFTGSGTAGLLDLSTSTSLGSSNTTISSQLAVKTYVDNKVIGPANISTTVNAIGSVGGGTQDIDLSLGYSVSATVDTSTTTFTFSNPKATGNETVFTLRLTNGGSQTVNWPASVDWAGGSAPTLTSSGVDELAFKTIDGGTNWSGTAILDVS